MEGPREIIRCDFPALGDGGDGLAGFRIVLGEALEKRHDHGRAVLAVGDVRIEIVGFAEVADVDRLRAVTCVDLRLTLATSGQTEQRKPEDGGTEKSFHGVGGVAWRGGSKGRESGLPARV